MKCIKNIKVKNASKFIYINSIPTHVNSIKN